MNILVLNGSPRINGNTSALVNAFMEGVRESNHNVSVISVCRKKIGGCLACEYCHEKGNGQCIQQDDMIDPRREILNMAMEKQIELLNQKVVALTRENDELKKRNEKLQRALKKQDLNFIKNL